MRLSTYLQHRRWFEALFALTIVALITTINATSLLLEAMRAGRDIDPVQPWIEEASSSGVVLLLLPGVIAACHRIRPSWSRWPRVFAWHVLTFVVFCLAHITLMHLVRSGIFGAIDTPYSLPGNWLMYFVYEARKDLLTYLFIVLATHAYGFVLTRLQGEANFLTDAPGNEAATFRQQFLVKMLQREYLVKIEEIDWIQSARNYVLLHCGARAYPLRSTMQALQAELDPQRFLRVHRTAFVNLGRVTSLEGGDGGDYRLRQQDGTEVPVSRTYLPDLRQALA